MVRWGPVIAHRGETAGGDKQPVIISLYYLSQHASCSLCLHSGTVADLTTKDPSLTSVTRQMEHNSLKLLVAYITVMLVCLPGLGSLPRVFFRVLVVIRSDFGWVVLMHPGCVTHNLIQKCVEQQVQQEELESGLLIN